VILTDRALQEQLLGREVRDVLTPADRRVLAGQRLVVTGAGGTLGGELARQIAACGPAELTLIDHSEYALFRIDAELRQRWPAVRVESVLADVTRRADVDAAVTAARPHAIYHAAAYKHVTITERAIVPAVRTNVLGTLEMAGAARAAGARFVLISTDKAAEPRSVMGATKRLAEMVALSAGGRMFRPVAVRFGNILGSSGSLIEIMARCVSEGRNVPLTHPDATRFFMTAEEAVSLVLKADQIGRRSEVFWLDMGQPVRIGTLAERFIELTTPAGQTPVGIEVIGLRPGEKMREHLTTQGLEMRATKHPRIWSARQPQVKHQVIVETVRSLRRAVARGDASAVLDALARSVDGFVPSDAATIAARTTAPRVTTRRLAATA
jgi:O-antigen biosynthesis protein WbqV